MGSAVADATAADGEVLAFATAVAVAQAASSRAGHGGRPVHRESEMSGGGLELLGRLLISFLFLALPILIGHLLVFA